MTSRPSLLELSELPAAKIRAVFSDLDDTLTEDSLITPATYNALQTLKERGYWLVLIRRILRMG